MDKAKLFSLSEKAVSKGQLEKALEALESILRSDSNDLKALNRAADIYLKNEDTEKAVEYLKRIGSVYSKDGFYSKAVAVYKRILKLDQGSTKQALIEIHEQLATLYGQLGLVSDAMTHFSIVVDFYDQTGDQELLLQVLKKVSDLDPFNIDSQLKLASLFLAQSKIDNAVETMQQLSENIRARGHLPDVVRIYERWVELFPAENDKLEQLVELYIKGGEPKKALARIQVAFRTDPKNSSVLELLSSTFRALKQPDKSKAVDIELIKIYRAKGEAEKALAVEDRIRSKTPDLAQADAGERDSGATRKAAPIGESVDAGESLIQTLDLDPEERKILAECDVYLKYGLTEKSHEVLTSKLGQFPQSLAMRWKLKSASQELQKVDETIHVLSEIVMLARTKKLETWVKLASVELQALDPQHPALIGTPSAPSEKGGNIKASARDKSPKNKVAPGPFAEQSLIQDLESSDISVVVEEEESIGDGEVSDISFRDLTAADLKKAPGKKVPSKSVKETEKAKIVVEKKHDQRRSANSIESSEDQLELSLDESPEVVEELLEEEVILSEADFTEEELAQLQHQLDPDEPTKAKMPSPEKVAVKISEKKTKNLKPSPEEPLEDILELPSPMEEASEEDVLELSSEPGRPLELSILSEDSSEVLSDEDFEVRQGLEEVDFFKAQGLKDEAEALLKNLKDKYPQHSEWGGLSGPAASAHKKVILEKEEARAFAANSRSKMKHKSVQMETLGTQVKLTVQEDERDDSASNEFYDLAGELNDELLKESHQGPAEIKDVFNAFKKGVSESVSTEDWQTHLDLGIAYREMGLTDDAIEEFKIVAKTQDKKVSAFYQIAITEMARQNFSGAKDYLDRALKEPELVTSERLSVSYELAEVLLRLNSPSRAKELLDEVKKIDPDFREVDDKIIEVTQKLKKLG